jgi:hypothetical protein
LPRVSFLVPASPNAAFYSQIAALNLALKALPWRRWEPSLHVTMGPRMPGASSDDRFDRWRAYVREVEFTYVSEARWAAQDNWAQVDSTLWTAPRNADVLVSLDADTFPVSSLEGILDEVLAADSVAGVMAHYPPPSIKSCEGWHEIADNLHVPCLKLGQFYSLVDPGMADEHRRAPSYFNGGVIFYASSCFEGFLRAYMRLRSKLSHVLADGSDFSGQIAIPFALAEVPIRPIVLPMRYNYPNDDNAIAANPGELEQAVIYHYLRTQAFDRRAIFASAADYQSFLSMPLDGSNLAFREAVRNVAGPSYPFPRVDR